MKIAKFLLIGLVAFTVVLFAFILPRGSEDLPHNANQNRQQGTNDRAEDPTYAEEVASLTAKLRDTETTIQKERQDEKRRLATLQNQVNALTNNGTSNNPDVENLKNQVEQIPSSIQQAIAPLQQQLARLSNSQAAQARNNSTTSGFASSLEGYTRIAPFGTNLVAQPSPDITGFVAEPTRAASTLTTANRDVIPVYTLHSAAILSDSTSITPLIGRVPNNGNVQDPFRFRIVTGAKNFLANGHTLPGVKNAIWSGFAVGVREESCVRAFVDTVSFVFEDGTIATLPNSNLNTTNQGSQNDFSNSLGFLASPSGSGCIQGTLINNASQFLRGRTYAAFAEGLANAFATSQTTIDRTTDGGLQSFVDGNTLAFGVGRGISRTAQEVATYLRQQQDNAFDVIYLPANQHVQIMIERQLNIDYDPNGRRVDHTLARGKENEESIVLP